jgi:hypothetical protein
VEYSRNVGPMIKYTLEKCVNGTFSVLAEMESSEYHTVSKARWAIVLGNGEVSFWATKESGKQPFEKLLSVIDSTYSEGYPGLGGRGNNEWVVDNFATGTFTQGEGGEKKVKVKIGGVIKEVKRWIMVNGSLVNK